MKKFIEGRIRWGKHCSPCTRVFANTNSSNQITKLECKNRLFLKLKISGNLELGWHKEWSEICRELSFFTRRFPNSWFQNRDFSFISLVIIDTLSSSHKRINNSTPLVLLFSQVVQEKWQRINNTKHQAINLQVKLNAGEMRAVTTLVSPLFFINKNAGKMSKKIS